MMETERGGGSRAARVRLLTLLCTGVFAWSHLSNPQSYLCKIETNRTLHVANTNGPSSASSFCLWRATLLALRRAHMHAPPQGHRCSCTIMPTAPASGVTV